MRWTTPWASALRYALVINMNGVLLGKLSGQVDDASGST
jgi:hypothetical protein